MYTLTTDAHSPGLIVGIANLRDILHELDPKPTNTVNGKIGKAMVKCSEVSTNVTMMQGW
jgi:hypothetical protein